jgi:hypothetical protein
MNRNSNSTKEMANLRNQVAFFSISLWIE